MDYAIQIFQVSSNVVEGGNVLSKTLMIIIRVNVMMDISANHVKSKEIIMIFFRK